MLRLITVLTLLLLATPALAAGPVNPTNATWIAPTTNADPPIFSPLTDLASYRVYIATGATAPAYPGPAWSVLATVPSAVAAPAPNTTVTFPLPALTDGQKYLVVTAVDTANNESAGTPAAPFTINRVAPVAPGTVQFQ